MRFRYAMRVSLPIEGDGVEWKPTWGNLYVGDCVAKHLKRAPPEVRHSRKSRTGCRLRCEAGWFTSSRVPNLLRGREVHLICRSPDRYRTGGLFGVASTGTDPVPSPFRPPILSGEARNTTGFSFFLCHCGTRSATSWGGRSAAGNCADC